jgi:hypothetical protein
LGIGHWELGFEIEDLIQLPSTQFQVESTDKVRGKGSDDQKGKCNKEEKDPSVPHPGHAIFDS